MHWNQNWCLNLADYKNEFWAFWLFKTFQKRPQGHTLPHWNALRYGKYELRGLSCNSSLNICQDIMKSAILLQGFGDSQYKGAFILLCWIFSVYRPTKFDLKVVTQALWLPLEAHKLSSSNFLGRSTEKNSAKQNKRTFTYPLIEQWLIFLYFRRREKRTLFLA